jgi:hypothetical protein
MSQIYPRTIIYPTRQDPESYGTPGLVQAAFITLRAGCLCLSSEVRKDQIGSNLHEYNRYNRDNRALGTSVILFDNGLILNKTTKGHLVYFSHRLKVPTDGTNAEYHREAFNVDPQCVDPPALTISGEGEIAKNKDAVIEILSFERDVVYGALTNWEGTSHFRAHTVEC